MKRYKSQGYNYATYYTVECPNCKKEATVKDGILVCEHCFAKIEKKTYLYNIYLRRNCPDCGRLIYTRQTDLRITPDKIVVACANCLFRMEAKPSIEKVYKVVPNLHGLKGDPYLGYPLWFQTDIKGNLFWAYNREHLVEIRTYVMAELREVNRNGKSFKMVTRLPVFVKDAKNREIVLKTIDRLLRK